MKHACRLLHRRGEIGKMLARLSGRAGFEPARKRYTDRAVNLKAAAPQGREVANGFETLVALGVFNHDAKNLYNP